MKPTKKRKQLLKLCKDKRVMSTRSGKRIHSSSLENMYIDDTTGTHRKIEKKNKKKSRKNLVEVKSVTKKPKNYVSIPKNEEISDSCESESCVNNIMDNESEKENLTNSSKIIRVTRRTTKLLDLDDENSVTVTSTAKKHKQNIVKNNTEFTQENSVPEVRSRKKNKKKKKRSIEDKTKSLHNGVLVDSFYNAAGGSESNVTTKSKKNVSETCQETPNGNFNKINNSQEIVPRNEIHTNNRAQNISKIKAKGDELNDPNKTELSYCTINNIDLHQKSDISYVVNDRKNIRVTRRAKNIFDPTEIINKPNDVHLQIDSEKTENDNITNDMGVDCFDVDLTKQLLKKNKKKTYKMKKSHFLNDDLEIASETLEIGSKSINDVTGVFCNGNLSELNKSVTPNKVVCKNNKIDAGVQLNVTFEKQSTDENIIDYDMFKISPKNEISIEKSTTPSSKIPLDLTSTKISLCNTDEEKSDNEKESQKPFNISSSSLNTTENLVEKTDNKRFPKGFSMNATFELGEEITDNVSFQSKTSNSVKNLLSPQSVARDINVTFDKSNSSHVSITSDESMSQNNVNISPILTDISLQKPAKKNMSDVNLNRAKKSSEELIKMQREGTFTVEESEIVSHEKPHSLHVVTPLLKVSVMPSPNINVTFDKSNSSHISITSDESMSQNNVNISPILTDSSLQKYAKKNMSDVNLNSAKKSSEELIQMQREEKFTVEESEIVLCEKPHSSHMVTPLHKVSVLLSPGHTPFHSNSKRDKSDRKLNITHSLEKSNRKSLALSPLTRTTRVMFCSPVNSPNLVNEKRNKIIKSSLKGSNKSFVFKETAPATLPRSATWKRSLTLSDADDIKVKRGCFHNRSYSKGVSTAKQPEIATPSEKNNIHCKSETKMSRTKLPNFTALHQKRFAKMESLSECQERKAKRARHLLTPTAGLALRERKHSKEQQSAIKTSVHSKPESNNDETITDKTLNTSKQLTLESLRPGYSRFGFKMNYDINPFSESSGKYTKKTMKSNEALKRTVTKKDEAKCIVMRERSSNNITRKQSDNREDTRTKIKGVRTNRRFDLQMKFRNIDVEKI